MQMASSKRGTSTISGAAVGAAAVSAVVSCRRSDRQGHPATTGHAGHAPCRASAARDGSPKSRGIRTSPYAGVVGSFQTQVHHAGSAAQLPVLAAAGYGTVPDNGNAVEPTVFRLLRSAGTALLDASGDSSELSELSACVLSALDDLHADDLGISPRDAMRVRCRSGIGYQEVYSGPEMTMCIFVLRRGAHIPLHDHPGMHVYGRLLFGQLRVRSFDPEDSDPGAWSSARRAVLRSDSLVGPKPTTYSLGPVEGNLHELVALEDSAFFDVLTPSYDQRGGRDCTYFRREGPEDSNTCILVPTKMCGFAMDTLVYRGPPFAP